MATTSDASVANLGVARPEFLLQNEYPCSNPDSLGQFQAIPQQIKEATMLTASFTALWQNPSFSPMAGLFSGGFMLFMLAFVVVVIIGWWKMFEKAGEPGWAAIIPIFNIIVLLKIAGRPVWWVVLYFIPLVNIVATIILAIDIAKAFGQSAVFGFFLNFLLGGIGYLILGFGNYQYRRPPAAMAALA
jgi:hypothetical protein